jgi:hypothetical protein
VEGNSIRGWESIPIITGFNKKSEVIEECISNSPSLTLWWRKERSWEVSLHQWVPGPGPGDFCEIFENQDDAIALILSYYFGENRYFKEVKDDVNLRRNALKKSELKEILHEVLNSLDTYFPEEEIDFKTELYKKIPIETWPDFLIRGGFSEYSIFKFKMGSLAMDAHQLKDMIYTRKECTHADWERLSSVLLELSRLAQEKVNPKE